LAIEIEQTATVTTPAYVVERIGGLASATKECVHRYWVMPLGVFVWMRVMMEI